MIKRNVNEITWRLETSNRPFLMAVRDYFHGKFHGNLDYIESNLFISDSINKESGLFELIILCDIDNCASDSIKLFNDSMTYLITTELNKIKRRTFTNETESE